MAQDTKLTIRVPRDVLENAKRYARAHDTTLTRLVTHYLERVSVAQDPLAHAPIVRRLSGSLPPQVSIDDYRQHLQAKYGRQD